MLFQQFTTFALLALSVTAEGKKHKHHTKKTTTKHHTPTPTPTTTTTAPTVSASAGLSVSAYVSNLVDLTELFVDIQDVAEGVTATNAPITGPELLTDIGQLATTVSGYAAEAQQSASAYVKADQQAIAQAYGTLADEAESALAEVATVHKDLKAYTAQFAAQLTVLQNALTTLGATVVADVPQYANQVQKSQATLAASLTASIKAYGGVGVPLSNPN